MTQAQTAPTPPPQGQQRSQAPQSPQRVVSPAAQFSSSEAVDAIAAALSSAQGEMEHASKDATNPAFKSKYANLASVVDACRSALSKAKIAVVQAPWVSRDSRIVRLETRLLHASGQWLACTVEAELAKLDPQSIGSAVTYLRRYSLAAMVGVAPDDDDDGNAASGKGQPQQGQGQPRQQGQGQGQQRPPQQQQGQGQGQQQRQAPKPPPQQQPAQPQMTPVDSIHAGRGQAEKLATRLGGEWPAWLASQIDSIGMAVLEPEQAEAGALPGVIKQLRQIVETMKSSLPPAE